MLHEIRVNGYAAEADGPLDLGTWGSYGTEQLHFTFDAAWDDLTKSVTFSTDGYTGEAVTLLLPESGRVEVPQQATAAQTAVTNMTNDLLKKNAEALKLGTIETAKESQRGIVDIETLQQTNKSLIETLDELNKIQSEGRAKRAAAEQELNRIEDELKAKMMEIRS